MNQDLLDMANSHSREFKFQYLVAASFLENNTIIAWFNNQAYHTAALTLSLVHNALVKDFFGSDHSIAVTNAPFKFIPKTDDNPEFENIDTFGFMFSLVVGSIWSVVSASYIAFYIKVKYKLFKLLHSRNAINISRSNFPGKREKRKIHAIRQWCVYGYLLGCIDFMGFIHKCHHHLHSHYHADH